MTGEPELREVATILRKGLQKGAFKEKSFGTSYCGACGTQHAKKWFTAIKTEAPFYVCLAKRPTFVVKCESKYVEFQTQEFEKLFSDQPPIDTVLRRVWEWIREHPLNPNEVEVEVILLPPFVTVKFHYQVHKSAVLQPGNPV